jgi:acetolactate synthase-1/2/3 large subunit
VAIDMLRVALRDKLRERQPSVDARRTRVTEMRNAILARRAAVIEQAKSLAPIHPAFVAHALNQVKDRDAIISDELGVPLPFLELDLPGCFLAGSSGGLGVGLGQALGAKLAAPHRQVITCCGDGSYMFGLPTASHYVGRAEKLPTLTIIMNNSMWYAVRRATLGMYPDGMASKANHLPMVDLTPAPDYEKIVEACGGYGERVEDPAKLIGAIERGLRKVEDGTAVTLNVVTRARE